MKTGADGYAEVQAMAKVNPIFVLQEFATRSIPFGGEDEAAKQYYASRDVMADLIDCARTILRTGFTIADHQHLAAILDRIV